jgi:anti-sigma factor RsiW
MARIIRLHEESHWALQSLLPWYVNGTLSPAEQVKVEAHLTGCADCQEELKFERLLHGQVAGLPLGAEDGWKQMQTRLAAEPPRKARTPRPPMLAWTGWAAAAALLVGVVAMAVPYAQSGRYHALGAQPRATPGNLVVIFRPETPEKAMRAAFNASSARLVDGPTGADAYVLAVPAARRTAALEQLRARPDVVLAEPVDPGSAP